MSTKSNEDKQKTTTTVARSDDGTIQINFTIPYQEIKNAEDSALEELAKEIEIPGFRKGNAPPLKVKESVARNTLLEKTLGRILPKLLNEAIEKHKVKPAIYPKFEIIKAQESEDWQIRAVTCELPQVSLGDYKKAILGNFRAKSIWTPSSAKTTQGKPPKEPSREEKEQGVIRTLLEFVKVTVPKILIEEEVNTKLSNLLERLEKLGLSLESYLTSLGKTAQDLRNDYEKQARDSIALELILNKVAEEEKLEVDPKSVEAAIGAASSDKNLASQLDTPERRRFIGVILKRRKALDTLVSLV